MITVVFKQFCRSQQRCGATLIVGGGGSFRHIESVSGTFHVWFDVGAVPLLVFTVEHFLDVKGGAVHICQFLFQPPTTKHIVIVIGTFDFAVRISISRNNVGGGYIFITV